MGNKWKLKKKWISKIFFFVLNSLCLNNFHKFFLLLLINKSLDFLVVFIIFEIS